MRSDRLFDNLPPDVASRDVAGLSSDSRAIKSNFAFFALDGSKAKGASYIHDAVARGAQIIVGEDERPGDLPASVFYLRTTDARTQLSRAAARFFPGHPETIVAVTGTAGKTSVADFTRQIFETAGFQSASLGTIGVRRADHVDYGALTTPDPVTLHETLHRLAEEGVTHLAMEASSHGLDQRRLESVPLSAAAFTNLGHDHLDYHGTREAYLAAKLRLFDTLLQSPAPAVVNADAPEAAVIEEIAHKRSLPVVSVGRAGRDIRLINDRREAFDQLITIELAGRVDEIRLPLAGRFQIANALVAAGLALAVGLSHDVITQALSTLKGVSGRLERVGLSNGGLITIDYAHKPEALQAALEAMRPFARGRLICVFGCGGDRDKAKRPLMGAIARNYSDIVIVTDDNPRSEDAALIRRSILEAVPEAREIGDRKAAIAEGIALLRAGDVLLIAGKGHERGQIIGTETFDFSDHDVVAACLQTGVRA